MKSLKKIILVVSCLYATTVLGATITPPTATAPGWYVPTKAVPPNKEPLVWFSDWKAKSPGMINIYYTITAKNIDDLTHVYPVFQAANGVTRHLNYLTDRNMAQKYAIKKLNGEYSIQMNLIATLTSKSLKNLQAKIVIGNNDSYVTLENTTWCPSVKKDSYINQFEPTLSYFTFEGMNKNARVENVRISTAY